MKNTIHFLAVVVATVLMSSCYTAISAITYADLNKGINNVGSQLSEIGYYQSGHSYNTDNDIYVSGYSGTQAVLDNDFVTKNRYTFTNREGNTLSFDVSYKLGVGKIDDSNIYYITDLTVPRCETSNSQDYNQLCGNNSPIYSIMYTPRRLLRKYDRDATLMAVLFHILVGGVVILTLYINNN